MLSLKVTVRLIATMMFLMGSVLYLGGSANAAHFCAQLQGATATGHPDCSFSSLHACRAHVKMAATGGGGGHCYRLHH